MKKELSILTTTWILLLIYLTTTIVIILFYFPLKNLINRSILLWFIYFYIPSILTISYAILKKENLIRFFSFKVEVHKWFRYLLFFTTSLGFIFVTISLVSKIKIPTLLFVVNRLDSMTHHFSFLYYIKMVILSPIFEEFIFRGIILEGFLTRYSSNKAIILSSLFFGLFHLNPAQIIYTFILGLFCGWYYVKTRNLLSCIIIHSINNLIAISALKYFINKLHFQVITTNTKLFQLDNQRIVFLLSLSLLIIGSLFLVKSLKSSQQDQSKMNDL